MHHYPVNYYQICLLHISSLQRIQPPTAVTIARGTHVNATSTLPGHLCRASKWKGRYLQGQVGFSRLSPKTNHPIHFVVELLSTSPSFSILGRFRRRTRRFVGTSHGSVSFYLYTNSPMRSQWRSGGGQNKRRKDRRLSISNSNDDDRYVG